MRRSLRGALRLVLVLASAFAGACAPSTGGAPAGPPGVSPEPRPWALAWSDEFEGTAGAPVDGAKWVADTGGQGWGNRELEYYTAGTANAALDGEGRLVITARAEPPASAYRC